MYNHIWEVRRLIKYSANYLFDAGGFEEIIKLLEIISIYAVFTTWIK